MVQEISHACPYVFGGSQSMLVNIHAYKLIYYMLSDYCEALQSKNYINTLLFVKLYKVHEG